MILALFIAWEIRICNYKLLYSLSLYICIKAVRLSVLLGCSPLSSLIGAFSAYHESHSFCQPATALTVLSLSLSLSLSHPRGPPLNILTHTVCFLFYLGALPSNSTLPNLIDAVTHFLFTLCLSLTQTHAHQHNLKIIYLYHFDHYS